MNRKFTAFYYVMVFYFSLWEPSHAYASDQRWEHSNDQLVAFPGAEGFNVRKITGGRGGVIRKVTNLNDAGPGSLRHAISGDEPKIVVFEVSGIIRNLAELKVGSNTTIAGQTSPAGITLYNWDRPAPRNNRIHKSIKNGTLGFRFVNNIIVRHIRIRGSGFKSDPFVASHVHDLILDHLSVSWGGDQSGVFWGDCIDINVQWCAFEEAVGFWHGEGGHNYGPHIGGFHNGKLSGNFAFHHNLMAHHKKRNPEMQIGLNLMADVRNCVSYNAGPPYLVCREKFLQGGRLNVIGNYRKQGPSQAPFKNTLQVHIGSEWHDDFLPRIHFSGNKAYDINGNFIAQDVYLNWTRYGTCDPHFKDNPISGPRITTHTAEEAYELVLAQAGAWPRDSTSRRTIEEVKNGTGGWVMMIPDQIMPKQWTDAWAKSRYPHPFNRFYKDEANDWPNLPAPIDSDNDGMPDLWEKKRELDPSIDDHNGSQLSQIGYTNIEVYINELAEKSIGKIVKNLPYQYTGQDYIHRADNENGK